jgi:hypothetical protein
MAAATAGLSDDLKFKLIVAGVGVLVVAYAAKRAANAGQGVIDSVSDAIGDAVTSVENAVSSGFNFVAAVPGQAWDLAQTPQTQFGPFNAPATAIVNAPSNLLDAASLGMISGQGGNTGSSNLGSWLWGIVNGDAFKPNGS